jgi:chromate transporter
LRIGFPAWAIVAAESFGGPVAQIGVLHRVTVSERRWISEEQFQRALNFCLLLPGPEAQQLATYIGWLVHGPRGAVLAGSLFVLPGFLTLLALSWLYVTAGDTAVAQGTLAGIRPAVVAIIAQALWRLAPRMIATPQRRIMALGAFFAFFVLRLPFPLVIAAAAAWGLWRLTPAAPLPATEGEEPISRPTLRAGVLWLLAWLLPLVLAAAALGRGHVLVEEGRFFALSALVTFGGAYAVLTYVAQEAVYRFQWVTPSEMVSGLGFAESTPGPLIMVVQFVAFLGAFRAPQPFDPMAAGVLASLLVTWVTFVPSFFFILGLGPFVERLGRSRRLLGALQGVSAAVFGAMVNLALWFALHTLFADVRDASYGALHLTRPTLSSIDWLTLAFVLSGIALLARGAIKHIWLLALAAAFGIVRRLLA